MTSASKARLAFAATLLVAAGAAAELAVPPLTARVTDQTATLEASQRGALEAKLAAFEAKKGSQIAVLIVPSTAPEAIEQYSIRVVEQWKLGRKGVDDGALLLVAKNDRRLRIEVGRGLEGALTDASSRRIIAEIITPRFKAGDFYGGIDAGVDRMIAVVEGEPLPAREAHWRDELGDLGEFDWGNVVFLGLFVVVFLGGILRFLLGRVLAAGVVGTLVGVGVWLAFGLFVAGAIAGFIAFVFALAGGSSRGWSSGGGGGWSSRSGGGGFSGGGGSFGGGGSSGSW